MLFESPFYHLIYRIVVSAGEQIKIDFLPANEVNKTLNKLVFQDNSFLEYFKILFQHQYFFFSIQINQKNQPKEVCNNKRMKSH